MCNLFDKRRPALLRLMTLPLFVLLAAAPGALRAQNYFGTIVGTVTDQSGAAVADAKITATNDATNGKYSAVSGRQGNYAIAQLPVGVYTVRVEQGSFKQYVATSVEVHTSTNTEVNVNLSVGSVNETVTVVANAVQVQTTSAEVGEVID